MKSQPPHSGRVPHARLTRPKILGACCQLALASCGGGGGQSTPRRARSKAIPPSTPAIPIRTRACAAPTRCPVQGIDVSKYQGDIDWTRVRDAGIRFAYLKVSEGGDHVDDRFYDNWEGAAAAGVPRGAYHFIYWCRLASEQAVWFTHAVPQDRTQLPPVLDLEWNNHSKTCPQKISREKALERFGSFWTAWNVTPARSRSSTPTSTSTKISS
jgi:GH25 family lysozyme M1 (1,4-beta-N-acetylmuramidase)